ncbi:MAG: hypothetical protein PHS14_18250 [Elusimicrobia bacterium]|nr:hypothetical protein [Elusimicrobiota bacterium]
MGTIQENGSGIKLAVPPTVYERMRETIDDLLITIRSAYANGIGNEDELRRAERLSIGLSADLGYIEVMPEVPEPPRGALRYRFQDHENGHPSGPALLVDYRVAPRELQLLRIISERPYADLSGLEADLLGVLDESLIEAIIREIRQHEEEAEDSDIDGYLADRRHDELIDRELEECIPFRGEAVAHE